MTAEIEVIGIRRVDRGRLRAFADVQLGDLILRDFVILDGPSKRAFVAVPRRMWVNGGQRYFAPLIDFRNGMRNKVETAILLRWNQEQDQKLSTPSEGKRHGTPASCPANSGLPA